MSMSAENVEVLEPSSFELPEDFLENPDDYELWSVRAPSKFDLSALNGTSFQFKLKEEKKPGQEPNITTFQVGEDKYNLSEGHVSEISSYRILGKTTEEDGMTPLPVSFSRHINLIKSTNANLADVDLAPSNERAPELDMKKLRMRIPYTPIDQKSGLKRRWNVMGAGATYTPPDETHEKKAGVSLKSPSPSSKKKSKKSEKKSKKKSKKQ